MLTKAGKLTLSTDMPSLNLNSAVETLNKAQLIESPAYSKKALITNKVTATFFDTASNSSSCTCLQVSTTEFRLGQSFSVELGLDKETNLPCASAVISYEL